MKKLIILDRDGVINYESEAYIKSPAEWIPIPGSLEAIVKLNQAGYSVAVATNQSGVGRGFFTEEILHAIHQKMLRSVQALGGQIDRIFYCPHHPDDHCACRKPKPGLLIAAADHFSCSLMNVPVIGDSWRDVEAALAVGCQPFLVQTGKPLNHQTELQHKKITVDADLANAVTRILHG